MRYTVNEDQKDVVTKKIMLLCVTIHLFKY